MNQRQGKLRLDQWLWYARFFKSRTIAGARCKSRKVRIDGVIRSKASALVSVGQTLTFTQGHNVRVVKILALGTHRGSAPEAQALFEDHSPPPTPSRVDIHGRGKPALREAGSGRPTKRERRETDQLKGPYSHFD
jgi:ribosome-associated heat shock protein Hsp15